MNHRRVSAAIAAIALTAALGCKKAAPVPEPAQAPAPPPAPAVTAIAVAEVQLGTAIGADRRVTAAATVFKPTDTIYAAVTTTGSAPRATLTARFTYQDGQTVNESSQEVAGAGVTEFHISKPDGWPAGDYTLDVLLDGRSTGTHPFKVQG
jgi:hypothetical protein